VSRDGFTSRTTAVLTRLAFLAGRQEVDGGGKQLSGSRKDIVVATLDGWKGGGAGAPAVAASSLLAGPSSSSTSASTASVSRSNAARTFFELLVLRTRGAVLLEQAMPYGDILVTLR
jgi:hypothetical protein